MCFESVIYKGIISWEGVSSVTTPLCAPVLPLEKTIFNVLKYSRKKSECLQDMSLQPSKISGSKSKVALRNKKRQI